MGGVYRRDFQRAKVFVNPGAEERSYVDPSNGTVIRLPAQTARILVSDRSRQDPLVK